MQTPLLAEKPIRKQFNTSRFFERFTLFWLLYYVVSAIMFIASGDAPNRIVVENTGLAYGWTHGFYLIPNFIASLGSDEYAIHQAGAGVGYDVMYVVGFFLSTVLIKNYITARRIRRKECCLG